MNSKAIWAIFLVMAGCGLNNVFLELLIREDPGCGHLITFLQFIAISAGGLYANNFGLTKPKIKIRAYLNLVFFFFITSILNNWAFSFNIPVPLHMIFRSGSLIANMILGVIILKKKYTPGKIFSVILITAGIIICTYVSSGTPKVCDRCDKGIEPFERNPPEDVPLKDEKTELFWWVTGIIILTTALLLSARMGIFQETLYKKYGKYPEEALFYTHALSLPLFIMYKTSIYDHFSIMAQSKTYALPIIGIELPLFCWYLAGNVMTQYYCIKSVYILTTECSSLTVTLVITLRKFMSLIFSIIYFSNPFTLSHWFGTFLVMIGTFIFTDVFKNISEYLSQRKMKKE